MGSLCSRNNECFRFTSGILQSSIDSSKAPSLEYDTVSYAQKVEAGQATEDFRPSLSSEAVGWTLVELFTSFLSFSPCSIRPIIGMHLPRPWHVTRTA
uniref:Uncharacterized protein n=1 Tax=Panagrellus redivivus TaxID=6233 RepID=A0A7E4V685_PANRE